jgi:hypothetical protein
MRPRRPGYGKLGRHITIKANHFAVACKLAQARTLVPASPCSTFLPSIV